MKNLILVTDAWHPQVNGVVTTLEKMTELAESYGWKITIIHPGLFKTIPTPTYPEIRTVINPWKLRKLIPKNIDSMHVATEGSLGIAARILAWKRNWFYTSGFHTNFPEYLEHRTKIASKRFYPALRWMHDRSKAVMVPSLSTKQKLEENRFKNVILWGRGFDEKIFYPPSPIPSVRHMPHLLYVGRVSIEKNLEKFLILQDFYNITVVGDGPARAHLEQAYPMVNFIGYRKGYALAEEYRSADVFVFPSLTDTFGIVMVEAMACGTPVAAFDVEGPRDVIENGVGGILNANLNKAIVLASALKGSKKVLDNAAKHTWSASANTFFSNLVSTTGSRFNT